MTTPGALTSALRSAIGVDEFIVSHRRRMGWRRRVGESESSHEDISCMSLAAQIFADRRQGRGASALNIDNRASLSTQIQSATARALSAIGPSWQLRPPSAPARVQVSDPVWQDAPRIVVDEILQDFIAHLPQGMRALQTELSFSQSDEGAILSNGFNNRYRNTLLDLRALVQAGDGRPVPLRICARQKRALRWDEELAWAAKRSMDYAAASPAIGADCDLVIREGAYTAMDADDHGLWMPLVQQSSAARYRSGIARYKLGQSITSKPARGDALSLSSDGSIDFGLQSAPFAADGQPVRRFALVVQGIAAGYQIDHREASLGATGANGGVRNLQIAGGSRSVEELMTPGERPLLVLERIAKIASETRGRTVLHIDRATLRETVVAGLRETPLLGGVISGDLYQWLEEAYYSREMHTAHGCTRPTAIRFNRVRLLP